MWTDTPLFDPEPYTVEPPPPDPIIVKGKIEIEFDFEADIAALVREFPKEFAGVDMTQGHEWWERASVFLDEYLRESAIDGFLGGGPHVKDTSLWNEPEITFPWTKDNTLQLGLALNICPCCSETNNPDPATCSFCIDQGHSHTT